MIEIRRRTPPLRTPLQVDGTKNPLRAPVAPKPTKNRVSHTVALCAKLDRELDERGDEQ